MTTEHTPSQQPVEKQASTTSLLLGRVFGIEIRAHFSVLVIFALIVTGLSANLFPNWHPEWTTTQNWASGFAAGILFFVSLLIHELSHSVVAQSRGIEISRITLFLFGGMAEMRGEPKTPKDEFLIAAAGPLASYVLSLGFALLAALFVSDIQSIFADPEQMSLTNLSPIATIFMWLSTINFVLATFNLLPGFPMDGGRLFRAALWWRTGDLVRATQMAARVGSGFGWVFMGLGAMQVFGGATVNGLWLVLIGWFIRRLALASVAQLVLDQALRGFTVSELMRTRFEKVPASVTLHQFVDDYLLRSSQQLWPVQDGATDVGYISLANINLEGQSLQQSTASVRDYMQPLQPDNYLAADISARDAFTRLANQSWALPVVDDGRVVGIIHQADILRWFSFHKIAP